MNLFNKIEHIYVDKTGGGNAFSRSINYFCFNYVSFNFRLWDFVYF